MFTTGTKLFLGASVLSLVGAIVFGVTNGGAVGLTGTIGLLGTMLAFMFLAGINFFTRDGNVSAMQEGAGDRSAAAQRPVGRSMWPLVTAVGAGLLAVGSETKPIVFKAGVVVLLAAGVEWMVQSWSERASADPAYNAGLRKRVLHPLEFPMIAALGLGVIIYSFSRIMLWVDKAQGPVAFGMVGAAILVVGFIVALKPGLKKSIIAGVCTVAALGIVSTGAVMAIDGQREITEYPTTSGEFNKEICEQAGESDDHELHEIDKRASQTVAAKASVAATVVLEDGKLNVYLQGRSKPVDLSKYPFPIVRSNPTNVLFRNLDSEPHRFTVQYGKFTTVDADGTKIVEEPVACTSLLEEGSQTLMTLKFPKSSLGTEDDYKIVVPGVDGQEILINVP